MKEVNGILTGGLGNQLFVLNATLYCAAKNSLIPKVSTQEFHENRKNIRKLEIQDILDSLGVSQCNFADFPVLEEKSPFLYDARLGNINSSVALKGYFQSFRYFSLHENKIKSLLVNKYGKEPKGKAPFINLHFRRGDYVTNPHTMSYHGLLSEKYFVDSVSILRSIHGKLQVRIFSDSKPEAIALSSLISDALIVDDRDWSALETLVRLSDCRALIGSNSSFSWWAAFLGSHDYGTVIFPKRWIRQKFEESEILFPDWIRIDDDRYYLN